MGYRTELEVVSELRATDNFYTKRRILYVEIDKNFNKEQIDKLMAKSNKQIANIIKQGRERVKRQRIKENPFLYCRY